MKLWELTSPEVADLPRDILVVVPVASLEQHSLHLPVFTDTMILEEAMRRLEIRQPEDILLLPVMWLGFSRHHSRYPGTVSAASATHIDMMLDIVLSLVDHGFTKVLIVNSHGGNTTNISVLLQRLMDLRENTEIFATTPYTAGSAEEKMDRIIEAGPEGTGHAGETETSMILRLRPDLVKTDRLQADGRRLTLKGVTTYSRFDRRTAHGGMGDPRTATAEKGERFFEAAAEGLAEIVRQIRKGNLYRPIAPLNTAKTP